MRRSTAIVLLVTGLLALALTVVALRPSSDRATPHAVTLDSNCLNAHLTVASIRWHSVEHIPNDWFSVRIEGTFFEQGDRGWFEAAGQRVSFTRSGGTFRKLVCHIP